MEAWRRVEVAACEELPGCSATAGPTPAELEAIRAATLHGRGGQRARAQHRPRRRRVRRRARRLGRRGRALDPLRADLLRRARHGARAAAARRGRRDRAGRARARRGARRRARASTCTRCASGARTACTPSRRRSGSSSRASRSRRTATPSAWSAPSRRWPSARSRAPSGPTRRPAPSSSGACSARLGLAREPVSTQVVARDRHAELLGAIALAGAGLERLATEIRHLQRTEVREAQEPFRAGQKGSSAMPHKRNPIKSEQITGLARVLRGNAQAALEDVALWHERDISHSSVERVILPDSTILIDYLQQRAIALVRGHRRRRRADAREPRADPRRAVLPARAAGARRRRHDARRRLPVVQELAQRAWDEGTPLRELLAADDARRAASTSTRSSTTATTCATPRRSSRGSTRSPDATASPDRPASLVASRT